MRETNGTWANGFAEDENKGRMVVTEILLDQKIKEEDIHCTPERGNGCDMWFANSAGEGFAVEVKYLTWSGASNSDSLMLEKDKYNHIQVEYQTSADTCNLVDALYVNVIDNGNTAYFWDKKTMDKVAKTQPIVRKCRCLTKGETWQMVDKEVWMLDKKDAKEFKRQADGHWKWTNCKQNATK